MQLSPVVGDLASTLVLPEGFAEGRFFFCTLKRDVIPDNFKHSHDNMIGLACATLGRR